MPSVYDLLARLLGNAPIRVHLGTDGFEFSCKDRRAVLRPVAWIREGGGRARVVGVGETPVDQATPIFLGSTPQGVAETQAGTALEGLLRTGFRQLPGTAVLQRPEVVFSNDGLLASVFNGRQREALQRAAIAAGAYAVRFEQEGGAG